MRGGANIFARWLVVFLRRAFNPEEPPQYLPSASTLTFFFSKIFIDRPKRTWAVKRDQSLRLRALGLRGNTQCGATAAPPPPHCGKSPEHRARHSLGPPGPAPSRGPAASSAARPAAAVEAAPGARPTPPFARDSPAHPTTPPAGQLPPVPAAPPGGGRGRGGQT